eukprot:TRINITY_DN15436_c0_g1_i1.p1 TRINITY_DN15436_c0_g1~~TRINITY_DN15436_c0_g1_i1.p1  ORF type:complete len:165 (-),score=13.43 TRINITY_DN15436_c0_g1_i1:326-775(-)
MGSPNTITSGPSTTRGHNSTIMQSRSALRCLLLVLLVHAVPKTRAQTPPAASATSCLASAGQACGASVKCGSGLGCVNATLCVAVRSVPIGGACADNAFCQIGSFCNQTTDRCQALLAAGSVCDSSHQCSPGAFCNTTSTYARAKIQQD